MTIKTMCIWDTYQGKVYFINFDSTQNEEEVYDDFCEENNISYSDSDYMVVSRIVDERLDKEETIT